MMVTALCTMCFANFGLRSEAERLADAPKCEVCSTCKSASGGNLTKEAAESLMHAFFVVGSIPPDIGGPASVYEFNPHHKVGEVEFFTDLDADLERLSDFLGVGLFHYGPPMWRLGYTEHYNQLRGPIEGEMRVEGEERAKLWRDILARCVTRTVDPGVNIFRVRKGEEMTPARATEFDSPPNGIQTFGRYESVGLSIFYGAEDVETCLHESRVALSDWIAVATFRPAAQLRLLDLSKDFDDSAARTPFERIDVLMNKFAFVGKEDYALCRELAVHIHQMGFDGFFFTSYFAQAHVKWLRNIALFGHPVADGKLVLKSVNRVRLSRVTYEFGFGPHNDTALPISREDVGAVSEAMLGDAMTLKEAASAMRALVSKRSDGPR